MRSWRVIAIVFLFTACSANAAEHDLKALLARYLELGLPLPPPDAPLVRVIQTYGGKDEVFYSYGFQLRPAEGGVPALVLFGTEAVESSLAKPEPIAAEALKGSYELERNRPPFPINVNVALALQCEARGWHDQARTILEYGLSRSDGRWHRGITSFRADLPPRQALGHVAFAHWVNALPRAESDWADLARKLEKLTAEEPAILDEDRRGLLDSLNLALRPSAAEPGSIDAMIDELVNCRHGHLRHFVRHEDRGWPHDPRYERLATAGFEAVPALLRHLEDKRLTRSLDAGFNDVGDLVCTMLNEMSNGALGGDWTTTWEDREGAVKKAASEWWIAARAQGEETYMVSQVLRTPHDLALHIVATRYPKHLPGLYREMLQRRPGADPGRIAHVIVAADTLSREQKIDLFAGGAANPHPNQKGEALASLAGLDHPMFVGLMVKHYDALPATPEGAYSDARVGTLAYLAQRTDDALVWDALARATRRADVGWRMELINSIAYPTERSRARALAHLKTFLEDDAVRDGASDKSKFDGHHAMAAFKRIEVRDLAAVNIAMILKLEPKRQAQDWSSFRAAVRKGLEKELR
jgi:hypothetical protein